MNRVDTEGGTDGPVTGLKAEAALHDLILDGCLDDVVVNYLLPQGRPHSWESGLWDYKRHLPNTSGRSVPDAHDDRSGIDELIKDAVAFHNAHGGYILAGVDHLSASPVVGCRGLGAEGFTIEKFNAQLLAYTKVKILCRFREVPLKAESGDIVLGLLFVPMRTGASPVVRMVRGAPELPGKKPAFRKGDIYARIDDQCIPVHSDLQGLQFVCSSRLIGVRSPVPRSLENNLPVGDPNLIRFVGRAEYLLELWTWLTDRHTPVKVLTALGGSGKTSIAFEFCRQLLSNPPANICKIVWLTAKKQAFSALADKWLPVARTDFETVDELFRAIAEELGTPEAVLNDAADRSELLDLVLDGLKAFPVLVVIDDVDSLDLQQQADLFSSVQVLAGRAFDGGTRFVLTSRLELNIGENQRLTIKGFEQNEFAEYAKMTAAERAMTLNDGVILRLHKVSLGSPVFCASILRLVSLGMDINSAISNWKDRAGEDVRRFAFERELEKLTDSQARTLFALCALGETTQLELKQVLNVDDGRLTQDLSVLRDFHLFASRGDPGTGTKLETPEPIRLMSDLLRQRISDPARIERECARARARVPKVLDKVAIAIAGILALWKADDYDAALYAAQQARKLSPKSGDMACVLGQCLLKVKPQRLSEADEAFRAARKLGCGRPELVINWLEARNLQRDWNGIVDIGKMFPPSDIRGDSAVIVANAYLELARQAVARDDGIRSLEAAREAMHAASDIIAQGRAGVGMAETRECCRIAAHLYVQLAKSVHSRPGDQIDIFNAAIEAFQCHVTETWIVDAALAAIGTWSITVLQRPRFDDAAFDILKRRLGDLKELHAHVTQVPGRHILSRKMERVILEINTISEQLARRREGYGRS